jgi:hypothetical protein
MKRVACIAAGVTLFFAVSAAAQAPTAGQKLSLATGLQRSYTAMKTELMQMAEKMPDADFGFKPGTSSELRTFGQWVGHQADNQFQNCAIIRGVANPSPAQANEKKMGKAVLVKSLADAFAFCDSAFSALTDQSVTQMVKQGEGETARGTVVAAMLSHGNESSGIMTVYLRAKGISIPAGGGGRGGRGGGGQ